MSSSIAFAPPFYEQEHNNYTIPSQYEALLIDAYSQCVEDGDDVLVSDLGIALHFLGIPAEIIPTKFDSADWCIEATKILDIDKWLYNGFKYAVLGQNIELVDAIWFQVSENKSRTSTISYGDLDHLAQDLNLSSSVDTKSMFKLASKNGNAITYMDMFIIMGRLGMIPLQ